MLAENTIINFKSVKAQTTSVFKTLTLVMKELNHFLGSNIHSKAAIFLLLMDFTFFCIELSGGQPPNVSIIMLYKSEQMIQN